MLQNLDDQLVRILNCPSVKFVERAGNTILEELGSSNPWAREWTYIRKDCLPCLGQSLIAAEIELETLKNVVGDQNAAGNILAEIGIQGVPGNGLESSGKVKISKEDRKSLLGCTKEGCKYVLECLPCRQEGK